MWHRHHGHVLPAGCKFSQGVADDNDILLGVVITGRPGGRGNQDGTTLEVTRRTTDGAENACSIERTVCEPGEDCVKRFCPDCTRYRQTQADAATARRIGGAP